MNNINNYIQEKLVINKNIKNIIITKENFTDFIHKLLMNKYGLKTTNFITIAEDTIANVYIKYDELKKHKVDINEILNDIKLHLLEKSKYKCDYISSSEMYKIIIEY